MDPQGWLPITEYAGKYRVSISTLRRRIKSGEVEYSFQEGKYLLRDGPPKAAPHPTSNSASVTVAPPQVSHGPEANLSDEGSPVLATANRLLTELKKAYSLILQEKENAILMLKDEVSDLRTLVRVLEFENDRLKKGSLSEPW